MPGLPRGAGDAVPPITDGRSGLRVLQVLQAAQRSLVMNGEPVPLPLEPVICMAPRPRYDTAVLCPSECVCGRAVYDWGGDADLALLPCDGRARIGERCILGQNVHVAPDVVIGNNVKLQNNVSVYTGVELEDDVFRPSCVFTNVVNPGRRSGAAGSMRAPWCGAGRRSGPCHIVWGDDWAAPLLGRGRWCGGRAGLCAHAGGAGGQKGWMSRHGHRLGPPMRMASATCPESGWRYQEVAPASCAVSTGRKTSLCRETPRPNGC